MSLINNFDLSGSTKTFSNNDLHSFWQQNIYCMDNDFFKKEYA